MYSTSTLCGHCVLVSKYLVNTLSSHGHGTKRCVGMEFPLLLNGNESSIHEDSGLISGLAEASGAAVGCGVGHRHSSDPVLLWLWCRLAAAALI